MKKFLTMGMLALVALSATLFISCSDDDESTGGSFKFICYINGLGNTEQINSLIADTYRQSVGSDATVTSSTDLSVIYIACKESNKEIVADKIKNTSLTALDAALENLHQASLVEFNVHYGETVDANIIVAHEYKMAIEKFLPGTYTSTLKNGSPIKLVISEPQGSTYTATVTIGSNTYNAHFELITDSDGTSFEFQDDTDYIHFIMAGDVWESFWHGFDRFTANVNTGSGDDFVRNVGLEFQRQ